MEVVLAKPDYGAPCNGCGLCCKAVPCPIAKDMLGAQSGPCPALEHDAGRYWCGMLLRPSHYLGMPGKSWADPVLIETIKATGGWPGTCDSD
jgi:hypothetical protein